MRSAGRHHQRSSLRDIEKVSFVKLRRFSFSTLLLGAVIAAAAACLGQNQTADLVNDTPNAGEPGTTDASERTEGGTIKTVISRDSQRDSQQFCLLHRVSDSKGR